MSAVLHQKYRPLQFVDVVGQASVTRALSRIIEKGESQAFLFSGPSGCGKTTLARIVGYELGCGASDMVEIDAATRTGVDDMRVLQEHIRFRPFGDSNHRLIICDEAHMLSRAAWNSILKAIEEPPDHITWAFCTTEPTKVPETIKTRCACFSLARVSDPELTKLFKRVCTNEKLRIEDSVADLIIRQANGSPRQMLVNLTLCKDAKTKKDAAELLQTASESDPVIRLCRMLIAGQRTSWMKAMAIVREFEEGYNAEGVRIVVMNYFATALKSAKTDRDAQFFLNVMQEFSYPYASGGESIAQLLLSIGRVFYAQEE